ncbi:MAG: glycosyltransferase family 8 protein [Candidatus Devosia phytovorans]|uniref:Glycosyltransferase family 8 protein n=1 Tax=Candidatus Devosia phytovorans TaxID=3121372 RepID=A0AAJ5VTQ8_9HYPH|nr:glycosyltransferase family 8 protein [Devosia sp.]WEK04030.1 MAG: glycosyltransferase family 8 protein [Devosia sp.]
MSDQLHIALCFDDGFWAPAYAVMRSICLSTKRRRDLVFHLIHLPLAAEYKSDLDQIASEYGATLRYYPLAEIPAFETFVTGMPASAQWPKIVYARLMLGSLLPANVSKVVYLDCDMMVRKPIEQLIAMELGGHPLGAVADSLSPWVMLRKDMRQNADIFDPADVNFNSGMLVIDLDQWRQMDFAREIATLAQTGVLPRLYYDQGVLNVIFRDRWQALPWRWNVIDTHFAHEALDPAILHFTGKTKPWAILAGMLRSTAYARTYRHVMTNDLFYRFARHRWQRWWKEKLGLR